MANESTIIAFRVRPEVKAAIGLAAKKRFTSAPEYLRRLVVDGVSRDGGFTTQKISEPERKVPA